MQFGEVSFFQAGMEVDLDNMEEYCTEVFSFIGLEKKKFTERIEREAATLSGETKDNFLEWNSDVHWRLDEIFPRLLGQSLFVTTYSFVESSVAKLAMRCEKDKPTAKSVKEYKKGKGSDLEKYLNYLKTEHGFTLLTGAVWDEVDLFRKIRNCIVHNDGKLRDPEKPYVVAYVQLHQDQFAIDDFEYISVTKNGNQKFLENAREFLNHLLKQEP